MILYRWQGSAPNFGDELNTILWPNLLPGFFDDPGGSGDRPETCFLGIGSILDARHPAGPIKLVAGSGYGGYERKPVLDRNWVIHWVRGPRTAAALGLPAALAIGDPAALVPLALPPPALRTSATGGVALGETVGFMPHFESMARGCWSQAAAMAGLTVIDPRDPPRQVVQAIRRCKLVLSEALHGAIVADAFRIPWIALRPLAAAHRAKWADWSDTVQLTLRSQNLPASSVREWFSVSRMGSSHRGRGWLARHGTRLDGIASEWLTTRAAAALRQAMQAEGQLSTDIVLDRCQTRMLDTLTALRRRASQPAVGKQSHPLLDRNPALRTNVLAPA